MRNATIALILLAGVAFLLTSEPGIRIHTGPQPDGTVLLSNGLRIKPAGRQVPLDTFPFGSVMTSDRRHLLVLNQGLKPPSISVLETATGKELSRTSVADGWLGMVLSAKGDRLYVGGGSQAAIFEFAFENGQLTPMRTFPIVDPAKRTHRDFIGDVKLSPDGRFLYAADLFGGRIVVVNVASGVVIERWPTGRRPYRILFHPNGQTFFVSSWIDGSVYVHETQSGAQRLRIRVGPQPTDMIWAEGRPQPPEAGEFPWVARLFVTASNSNQVYAVGITAGLDARIVEVINLAFAPRQPAGMTPSALALSQDSNRLFVVCSDANTAAVVDIREGRSIVEGFIPTGWYPTAVHATAAGGLIVLNGKGQRSFPNPMGPNPTVRAAPTHLANSEIQYAPRMQTGTASFIEPFDGQQLDQYTREFLTYTPYRDTALDDAGVPAGNPIPAKPGGATPIRHVIYVLKENRTYDQVFGAIKEGNGDPSLVLFGEDVTPNHHKLAREFVLLDNFYVNSDVSADGHNWSSAAIAPSYVQKMWPNSYGQRRRHYDYEGTEPAAMPPAGYIWNNALSAGITLRMYGWWVNNRPEPTPEGIHIASVRDPALAPHTNMRFRGYDLTYRDIERVKVFLEELAEYEKAGGMPRLILMRLGNDHTYGAAPGRPSPRAMVADNDYALGMLVEGVSKSKFWESTAIFVIEDDAQNGPDHVDSHRSIAFVISPYAKRRVVDSTWYNTTSVLRTMELLVGLQPMTIFDAFARPMASCFQSQPDTRPYEAEKPRWNLDEVNPQNTALGARTLRMDLSEADLIDDDEMNDILWRAIKGTEPPPPVTSIFSH